MTARINVPSAEVAAFCRNHHVRKLSLFGSVLRPDFRPDSDVDILVEFDPQASVGLFELARMEHEMAVLLGRPVDLREPEELSPMFRAQVLAGAEVAFAAA